VVTASMTTDADTDADADRNGWMILPTAEHAAAYATPFPGFDAGGDWEPRAAVHDIAVTHMVRLAEQEGDK